MKARAQSREGMIMTSLALDRDMHRRLAIMAVEQGVAQVELVRRALRAWLDRKLAPPVRVPR